MGEMADWNIENGELDDLDPAQDCCDDTAMWCCESHPAQPVAQEKEK